MCFGCAGRARASLTRRWLPGLMTTVLVGVAGTAWSTTVAPIGFDEMVSSAESIFIADVVGRQSVWETGANGRRIVTHVAFDVSDVLKGHVGLRTELSFLGGTVGDVSLEVAGTPRFQLGERNVLFVAAERQAVSPLVGLWQGRFRVTHDATTGASSVRTQDGGPVLNGLGLGRPGDTSRALRPLALADFEAMVRRRVDSHQRD